MTGRIGFVDDRLDNFHADVYLKLLRGDLADLGFRVTGCTALQAEPSRQWATANDVPWFDTVDDLNAEVDHFIVLAPSTPETHLTLCEAVFPHGKSSYVDKTFAPDLATAQAIFALADQHRVAVQTTSALRYTNVQNLVASSTDPLHHMVTWGGGSSFEEYAIHPVEMIVSCLGPDVLRLMRWEDDPQRSRLLLEWASGATGIVHVYTDGSSTPFAASISSAAETRYVSVDAARIFSDTARAFLELFTTGQPGVNREESLSVRRILDAAAQPEALKQFIDI
ncbi:MAG: hypothetical protein HN712_22465 [Gemmatimonadetes bacterium]|jgi:hypothetical protein|nr:hypothetical protein [Gemmatimonadota bacterium]MBT7863095.1 hypothetical protein [Gemmatimonadota bacterium]